MVTAEIALGLTALGMVLAAGLWTVALVADQMRCQDAARDVARAIARGESEQVARAEGRRAAPEGARIRIAGADGWAEVVVSLQAVPPWPVLEALGDLEVRAEAAVAYEPGEQLGSGPPSATDSVASRSSASLAGLALATPLPCRFPCRANRSGRPWLLAASRPGSEPAWQRAGLAASWAGSELGRQGDGQLRGDPDRQRCESAKAEEDEGGGAMTDEPVAAPARPRSSEERDAGSCREVDFCGLTASGRPSEGGSGTVLVLATGGVLLTTLGAVTVLTGVLTAQHRVDVASELAALSAAGAVDQGDPCRVADRVAREHRVQLASCVLVDGEAEPSTMEEGAPPVAAVTPTVRVTVRDRIEPFAGFRAELTASSVAGG